jgi:hypothetical protein
MPTDFVDGHDIRMLQTARQLGFALEAGDLFVTRQLAGQRVIPLSVSGQK